MPTSIADQLRHFGEVLDDFIVDIDADEIAGHAEVERRADLAGERTTASRHGQDPQRRVLLPVAAAVLIAALIGALSWSMNDRERAPASKPSGSPVATAASAESIAEGLMPVAPEDLADGAVLRVGVDTEVGRFEIYDHPDAAQTSLYLRMPESVIGGSIDNTTIEQGLAWSLSGGGSSSVRLAWGLAPDTIDYWIEIAGRRIEPDANGIWWATVDDTVTSFTIHGPDGPVAIDVEQTPIATTTTPAIEPTPTPPSADAVPQPIIEQPTITGDVDAIDVTTDASDWAGRALFAAETPDGYTIEFVSREREPVGDPAEQAAELAVQYVTTTPNDSDRIARVRIETLPGGIEYTAADTPQEMFRSVNGVDWEIHVANDAGNVYWAGAVFTTGGAGAMVSSYGHATADEAAATAKSVIDSLRLVSIEDIPTEVVTLDDMPVVARTGPDDIVDGLMRAARTTNAWCFTTTTDGGSSRGCGAARFDPATTPGAFTGIAWDPDGIFELSGVVAAGVATVEVEFADGQAFTVEPTPSGDDGTGFWIATRRYNGELPMDGSGVTGRALAADGSIIGTIDQP